MSRNFAFVCGMFALGGTALAAKMTVTQSDRGNNHALVIQSGPEDGKPKTEVRRGPGFVVIEQHSGNNSATITQGN